MKKMTIKLLCALLGFISLVEICRGQIKQDARWCTTNDAEYKKCLDMIAAVNERKRRNLPYPFSFRPYDQLPTLKCVQGVDQFDCMIQIANDKADLIDLEPGMAYTAGEYNTLQPLMAEKYTAGTGSDGTTFKAVAVVLKANTDINYRNLVGKKSCHTGVGTSAGWVYPISQLIRDGSMPIVQCNVPVKSAASYFGTMCAPNALTKYYNPFGNNPVTVCKNCKGSDLSVFCTSNDPYANYDGAFNCLAQGSGDVAFIRHDTVTDMLNASSTIQPTDFELLCVNGTRAAVTDYETCNWGTINSHVVMTSGFRAPDIRAKYKELIGLLSYDFGDEGKSKDIMELFSSIKYGKRNLLFTDTTYQLVDVGDRDTYYSWVGEGHRQRVIQLNTCPLKQVRWCVLDMYEMQKCEDMIMAFSAKNLKPDLNCVMGDNVRDCMNKINLGDADLMSLDAADTWTAGKHYQLVPIAVEDYSGTDQHTFYAVAVARKTDSHLTIFNLKQRRTCHGAVMSAAGWVIPMEKLIETIQFVVKDCNVYHSVGQYFSKSCAPGILDAIYNPKNSNPINMCEACATVGNERCLRNNLELYYGSAGAFRCLVENGGDVAFVRHTTARENLDGRNVAFWSRNRRSFDYQLLCNDGTRADIDSWASCNMGEVPSNAIVTSAFKSQMDREIFWTLLNYAQQFFASDDNPDFPMFSSYVDFRNLIFQDATVRLSLIDSSKQDYKSFLGENFVRSMERMAGIDCYTTDLSSASTTLVADVTVIAVVVFLQLLRLR